MPARANQWRRAVRENPPDGVATVDPRSIPDDHHLAGQLAPQMLGNPTTSSELIARSWRRKYSLPSGEMALIAERWSQVHHSRTLGVWPTGA
jgi:hypothetical protein